MAEISERHFKIMSSIERGLNGITSADSIAHRLGYRPCVSGRLAVSSNLRAMQRANLVGRIPPKDRWDHAKYFLTKDGKEALNTRRATLSTDTKDRGAPDAKA